MKRCSVFLILPLLVGCFEDQTKLAEYYAEQEIDVAQDSVVCFSGKEDFTHFQITCSEPSDSIHWYATGAGNNQSYLGNEPTLEFPVELFGWDVLTAYAFNQSDTIEYNLILSWCARFMYLPMAFTPDGDGLNDIWRPVYTESSESGEYKPYSVHWEIRSLNGILLHEAEDFDNAWDGTHNGYYVPKGAYLYYIELTIEGAEPVVYTGWLEMLG